MIIVCNNYKDTIPLLRVNLEIPELLITKIALILFLIFSVNSFSLDPRPIPDMSRGAFLLFEGVDRCGKTTQANMLTEFLKTKLNGKVEFIRFPDRTTPIGQMINSYLTNSTDMDDHAIHLLFSANRWEARSSILSKLEAGITLVCDRYVYSGVAFSGAKDGLLLTTKKGLQFCMSPDKGLPAPDLVLFLDVDPDTAAQRGQYGEERYEKLEMQQRVRQNFQILKEMDMGAQQAAANGGDGDGGEPAAKKAATEGEDGSAVAIPGTTGTPGAGGGKGVKWTVIDATRPIDIIASEIQHLAMDAVQSSSSLPIREMWMDDDQK